GFCEIAVASPPLGALDKAMPVAKCSPTWTPSVNPPDEPMPSSRSEVTQLLRKLLEGDEDAATELVARYSHPLRVVIRRHLDARVRPALDSADVEQQVWGSFFCRELYREALESPEKLRQFLVGIARRKALMASRDHLRDKRDRRREVPLDQAAAEGESFQA